MSRPQRLVLAQCLSLIVACDCSSDDDSSGDGGARARGDAAVTASDSGSGVCGDVNGDGTQDPCGSIPNCKAKDLDRDALGPELCDGEDNDCDGEVDERVKALCPVCAPSCEDLPYPQKAGFAPTDANSERVIVDADGALTLDRLAMTSHAVWVANTGEGTVSKLDARTNVEIARYVSALPGVNPGIDWRTPCVQGQLSGNCPSRTAVDQSFDAYVANRAFGSQGSVTKFAGEPSRCVDSDHDGTIDTSSDVNGDGIIDMNDPDEFFAEADECVLWTVPVGTVGGLPRALAVGQAPPDALVGGVWVGLYDDRRACRLDAATGRVQEPCVDLAHVRPYGAVSDATGRIWFAHRGGGADMLGYVAPATDTFTVVEPWPAAGCEAYGITVDSGGRLGIAATGDKANDPACQAVHRYDPSNGAWDSADYPGDGTPRGVASDGRFLWVAISHEGNWGASAHRLIQLKESDLSFVATHDIPGGADEPVGVGVAFDGSIWAVCKASDQAARLDPKDGSWIVSSVGNQPYTYSDFVGYGLHMFTEPKGRYAFVLAGCAERNRWYGVDLTAETPAGTKVEVWVRAAPTEAELSGQDWLGPFAGDPVDLTAAPGPVPEERYLEVELRLSTDDDAVRPRVFSVDVIHDCTQSVD